MQSLSLAGVEISLKKNADNAEDSLTYTLFSCDSLLHKWRSDLLEVLGASRTTNVSVKMVLNLLLQLILWTLTEYLSIKLVVEYKCSSAVTAIDFCPINLERYL